MSVRIGNLAALGALLGFGFWLYRARPDTGAAERAAAVANAIAAVDSAFHSAEGSVMPCATPLPWRIARVDPEFGISADQAHEAVVAAARLWERAARATLFPHDSAAGMPIRFVFDERQADTQARNRIIADLEREGARLATWRETLAARDREVARLRDSLDTALRDLGERIATFNATVSQWNDAGGAPDSVFYRMRARESELQRENEELQRRREALARMQDSLRIEAERFNRDAEAHARRAESFEATSPARMVESGQYREAARIDPDGTVTVEREVRIYRYDDWDGLVLLIAHELGHALGLGHVEESGSVMSEAHARTGPGGRAPDLHAADIEAAREVCLALFAR